MIEVVHSTLVAGSAGLTSAEARARLDRDGPNELPAARLRSPARLLADQLLHFFAIMLWVASGLAVLAGLTALAIAIVIVIVVNADVCVRPGTSRRSRRGAIAVAPPAVGRRQARRSTGRGRRLRRRGGRCPAPHAGGSHPCRRLDHLGTRRARRHVDVDWRERGVRGRGRRRTVRWHVRCRG